MSAPVLDPRDRLLSARQAAKRLQMGVSDFRALVKREPLLIAARRYRGRRALYIATGVVRFMREGMSGKPEKPVAVPPQLMRRVG